MATRSLIALALMVGGAATAWAGDAYPTRTLLSTGQTVMDETIVYPITGPARVTANVVTVAPGAETVRHRHGTPMFAYILEGELAVDYGERGTRVFKAGDAFVETMAVPHRGRNLGPVPVRILAVSMGAEGAADTVVEPR